MVGEAGKGLTVLGEAHGSAVPEEQGEEVHGPATDVARQAAGGLESCEPSQERLHVGPAEPGRPPTVIGAAGEELGEQPDRGEHVAHRGRALGAESVGGPRLGRSLQPRLSDCGGVGAAVGVQRLTTNERQSSPPPP